MQDFAAIAKEFGVDESALKSLLTFMFDNINRTPETRAAFEADPVYHTRQGILEWKRRGDLFYAELLEGKSDNAIKWRKEIADQVYEQARAKQGLTA